MSDSPLPPLEQTAVLRILDANANRAEEGLRVVEDYFRFARDDQLLARLSKQLRHDLAAALAQLPLADRLAARNTPGDVGTSVTTADEYRRQSAQHVAWASQKRMEQALRALEEYSKVISHAGVARQFEQLRYRAYTLGGALEHGSRGERLTGARLYVLINGRDSLDEFTDLARTLIEAGVHVLQLRDKRLLDRELLERARRLRDLTAGTSTIFIMNDRADLAVLAAADGVHVGQDELTVKDARTLVGPQRLVGVSTHSLEQARQAVLDGADYVGCGPTFPSHTKEFAEFPGTDLLRQVAGEIRLPAFAIGGVTLDNLRHVLDAGFCRVAVGQAVLQSADPAATIAAFMTRLSA